ncbi:hypothetical protein [Streptomyces clavuligerus]|uniref:hypothetical protein n=1 Tax=Streptomyces clavuligerus TaxID=1901 RepID=UPI0003135703|nr:hypothetical protein [Streptomyces clavuligerus]AXU11788.1 hypothetical protein D1794_03070 [Streptomyces clavuligerus]MBY6301627.1 hypothetical protein [Streptomyces clavuligerus]QCS04568.1 hypothetical protein CRV15_02505 [Streptomyces clavuligerus]QPJ96056.1 hypothetical protein GE265_25385 [Streptomyces clavuligerus]QPL66834.1 hypothetical protein I3J04_02910 [Streptomyces clavuligerus]
MTRSHPVPPNCSLCPDRPPLWKDTTTAALHRPERWLWYCAGCRRRWEPTGADRQGFTWGVTGPERLPREHCAR